MRTNGLMLQVVQGMKLGMVLKVLSRNDYRVDARCLGRLAYLLVMGVFNSIYGTCEAVFNQREIDETELENAPLFILGHWRSGTTHLHNLLAQDENLTCPSAYQALFPHHFVFSQAGSVLFNLLAPAKRPMDNVAFFSEAPHEDEFALAAISGISPYMRWWFPLTADDHYAAFDPQRLDPEALLLWKESLVLFLKKVTLSEGGRIVLKSPPHLGRVRTLVEMFPKAQFIHIVRNPYVVYLSTHKLWRDSLSHCHLQIPGPEFVDEAILSLYTELFSLFERDRHLITPGALHELKFEDLEEDPVASLARLYEDLGLPGFSTFKPRVLSYLASLADYQKNEYRLSEADCQKVRERWGDIFDRYGYEA